jgi:hypothetical protein
MPLHVVNGAILKCSSGAAPAPLTVLPVHREQIEYQYAANIMDHVPIVNIPSFGACANLSGGPCVPATPAPWTPGAPTVTLDYQLALDSTSMLACTIGGMITIMDPGEHTDTIP